MNVACISVSDLPFTTPPHTPVEGMAGDEELCSSTQQQSEDMSTCEEGVEFEDTGHSYTILTGLANLREQGQLFDVVLTAQSQSFQAHRVVLASCSDYFRAMFTDDLLESHQDEITLNGVTAKGMEQLIDYAYTSKLSIRTDNVLDILSASSHFQMMRVIKACSDFLKHQLTVENCVDVLTLADMYSLSHLQTQAYRYMCSHFTEFTLSPCFQRLSASQLETLLLCNYPVNCPEWEVCYMILHWIQYQMEERLSHAEELLMNICFQEIKVSELLPISQSDTMKEILAWNPSLKKCIFSQLGSHKQSICSSQNLVNRRGYKETVIVAGGFTNRHGMTNDILYLDTDTSSWKLLTKIPHVEQCNFGVSVLNNCLYVLGGCFDQHMQEVVHPYGFKFDPLKNKWSCLSPMIEERCRFYLGAVGNRLYAVGGDPSSSDDQLEDIARCECYNPDTNSWSEMSPLTGSRTQHAGTAYYNSLYVSGGFQELDNIVLDTLDCYDTRSGTWSSKSAMLSPRADHAMFVYENKIYVAGGWFDDSSRVLVRTVDCYNVNTDQWEMITHLPEARLHATCTSVQNLLFVIGGSVDGDYDKKTKQIDILDLEEGTWKKGTELSHEIWEHVSCSMYLPTVIS